MENFAVLNIVTNESNTVWLVSLKIEGSGKAETKSTELPADIQSLEDYYTLWLNHLQASRLRSVDDFEVD